MRKELDFSPYTQERKKSRNGVVFIHSRILGVDDFGNVFVRCHWTGCTTLFNDIVLEGSFFPYLHTVYASHKDCKEAKQDSYRLFADSEQNCNTCKHFKRLKVLKHGFFEGSCHKRESFTIHPNDWMGMECYKSRWDVPE